MLLQIGQNWHFQHRIKQLKVYSIMFIQNSMIAALDLLLLVTKSLYWRTKTNKQKLEIWKLKFMMSESLCGVKLWYYKVWLLLVECI